MPLNLFKSPDQTFMLMQKQWISELNPFFSNVLISGSYLKNIKLINGAMTFDHFLGKQMTGYIIVDQNASAKIYRSQPLNTKTLTLTSDAAVTVSLWVF